MRHTQISIHQNALSHNVKTLKSKTKAKLLAMVKADAYGHGITSVVPALAMADGFGVACMSEALAVKSCLKSGDCRPIVLIEGVFSKQEWQQAMDNHLMVVVHHQAQLAYALAKTPAQSSHSNTIWLKYNTGMNRLGFDKVAVVNACQQLIAKGYQVILTSHFACADEPNHPLIYQQMIAFDEMFVGLKAQFAGVQASLCNSAGIFALAQAHYDWVRSGIALYGASPFDDKSAQELNLVPAMTLSAKLIAIHCLQAGETLGYGAMWVAKQPSRIGIVSIGYGDGYPRVVNGAKVFINGQFAPIVGRVSMDMLAVDLTHLTASLDDEVVLWGQGLPIEEVAKSAGTIAYELMCRLTSRPYRIMG